MSIDKVKETLGGETPAASSEALRGATWRKRREEGEEAIFEQQRASVFEIMAATLRPINSSDLQPAVAREDFYLRSSGITKSTQTNKHWRKENDIRQIAPLVAPAGKTEVRTRRGRSAFGEESGELWRDRWNPPSPPKHEHRSDVPMHIRPQRWLEGNTGCIKLRWWTTSGQRGLDLPENAEDEAGPVIWRRARRYLSNISHTINISLSISVHLSRGIGGTWIFFNQNERSNLSSTAPTDLTGGLMNRNERGIMGTGARWEADGVMSVAYYLQGQLQ